MLSLDDIGELFLLWREHPPLYLTAQAALRALGGGAPPARRPARPAQSGAAANDEQAAQAAQLIQMFGAPARLVPRARMLPPP